MTTMMPLVRIVDDDAPFRTSQAMLLRMSGRDVAEYDTAQDFLARDDSSRPGCLILDVRMPGMTGLELQKALEMTGSTLPVIFLTGHGDVSMAVHTMRHGAADFLEKPVMPAVLFASVERACSRSMALYASMLREREERAGFYRLTPREQQVVLLAASDTPNRAIGEKLSIGEATVKMHRANAFAKLGVKGALEAYRLLTRIGILKDDGGTL